MIPCSRCLFLVLLLGLVLAWTAPQAVGSDIMSPEFKIIQSQVKKARDKVMPALVRVQPIVEAFRGGRKVSRTGFGSGVIIGPQGYVITNYHVAGRAKSCLCVMANKEEVPAELIGGDPWTDIAVIRLDLSKYTGNTLTWAVLGDSSRMEEGDFVLAMGSPFALTRTVTFGIVSCKDRSLGVMGIEGYQRTGQFNTWLQIDALINPGNSGGPLVNIRGEVVGINARGGAGMGFAIPINIVKEVSAQLIEHGEVRRSWIGVKFQPMEKFKKNFLGGIADSGVLVANVDEGSPAALAGLRAGDVIISLNGRKVAVRFEEEIYPIAKRVADMTIGTRVTVDYIRKKQKYTARFKTEALEKVQGDEVEFKEWGFTARQITRSLAREMRLPDNKGVMVTGSMSGSVAYKASLRSGDILKIIDGTEIKGLGHFKKFYKELLKSPKKKLIARVLKGGRTPRVVILKVGGDGEKKSGKPGKGAEKKTAEDEY